MNEHAQQVPEALVLRWNSQTLVVSCPYCLYSHRHGFAEAHPEGRVDQTQPGWKLRIPRKQRASDCAHREIWGEYTFVFPRTSKSIASEYGWEVDRTACEFVTVNHEGKVPVPINDGLDGRTLLPQYQKEETVAIFEDSEDDCDGLNAATNALSLEDNLEEPNSEHVSAQTTEELMQEIYSGPNFRRKIYDSSCVNREVEALEWLRLTYPHDQFIGTTNEEGDTGALLAATEENGLRTLRWLQEHGDRIDKANHYGRTPLMEAALWGRLETVKYLSQQPIDLKARDGNGMQAVDLAADTERNTKERVIRAGKIYREQGDAGRQRKQIHALLARLTSAAPTYVSAQPAPQRRAFFARTTDGKLQILRPQELLQPPMGPGGLQLQKAFATLDRGANYPYVNVMSGYSHPDWPNVLDNTIWTEKANDLRDVLGLPRDKSLASHVESQLLAYLLERHTLVDMFRDEKDLRALESGLPAYDLQPVITVSKRDLCDSCKETFKLFKKEFRGVRVVFNCVGDSVTSDLQQRG